MKEIHIACAGAGKTYCIAHKIMDIIDECPDDIKIYVITYTNYAVMQIEEELIKENQCIPEKVIISTVHNFLLNNIIYPYFYYVKGEAIKLCSIERLPNKDAGKTRRRRVLKNAGIIHSDEVFKYSKSVLVALKSDTSNTRKRKEIAVKYFINDIHCLCVDEAQDMDNCFFELMIYVINKLDNYYFVGDPFQALRENDRYFLFTKEVNKQEKINPQTNFISRRLPVCITNLCNKVIPVDYSLRSINNEKGVVEYVMLSELDNNLRKKLRSGENMFSYIKNKTDIFTTGMNKISLTHEFTQILEERYPQYDIKALSRTITCKIHDIGLDKYLRKHNINLSKEAKYNLSSQFTNKKEKGIYVESIHKVKGLESDTAYFIICNSLLEILLGIKNNFDKESNLLYVALTRTKRRLLLIMDDNNVLKNNLIKRSIDIHSALHDLGIKKAILNNWF